MLIDTYQTGILVLFHVHFYYFKFFGSVERDSLQEELGSTRDKARVMLLEQGGQLAQATLDVSLLQHRVRCLTSNTHSAVTSKVFIH